MSSDSLVRPGLTTPFTGNLDEIKLRLRRKVPKLTADDVRRARIPYYEAITSELYEAGFVNAAFLVLHLIEYEDKFVGRTSNPLVEARRLRYSEQLLNYLRESLADAEICKQEQRHDEEVGEMLAIAKRLELDREKRWLARQFFLIALDRCVDCLPVSRVKIESLVRYYFAKFLVDRGKHLEAMTLLEQADTDLERAVPGEVEECHTLEDDGERLITAISALLFATNRHLAEQCKTSPAWMSEQYIRDAHKAAVKTCKPSTMAESYLAYGDFLFTQMRYQEALGMYKNAMQQAELDGDKQEFVCAAALAQAASYHRLRQPVKCEAMFRRVDGMTQSREQSLCRANFYYTSASLQLEDAGTDPARVYQLAERLRRAANLYRHFGLEDKSAAARCLEARVRAEDGFGRYVTLLPAAISTSDEELYRVIDWVGF